MPNDKQKLLQIILTESERDAVLEIFKTAEADLKKPPAYKIDPAEYATIIVVFNELYNKFLTALIVPESPKEEEEPHGLFFNCVACQITAGKITAINLSEEHPICPVCGYDYMQTKIEIEAKEDEQFMDLIHKNIERFLKEKGRPESYKRCSDKRCETCTYCLRTRVGYEHLIYSYYCNIDGTGIVGFVVDERGQELDDDPYIRYPGDGPVETWKEKHIVHSTGICDKYKARKKYE